MIQNTSRLTVNNQKKIQTIIDYVLVLCQCYFWTKIEIRICRAKLVVMACSYITRRRPYVGPQPQHNTLISLAQQLSTLLNFAPFAQKYFHYFVTFLNKLFDYSELHLDLKRRNNTKRFKQAICWQGDGVLPSCSLR